MNHGFVLKDARSWADGTFPLAPTYQVGDGGHQLTLKAYLGATVGQAEDWTGYEEVQYVSADPTVATVSSTGWVTPLKPGTTRITALHDVGWRDSNPRPLRPERSFSGTYDVWPRWAGKKCLLKRWKRWTFTAGTESTAD